MREYKFRGKVAELSCKELDEMQMPHDNGWVHGNLLIDRELVYIVSGIVDIAEDYIAHECWVRVNPKSVGQYTGLEDKNGKVIYEGDVLKSRIGAKNIWKVLFEDGAFILEQIKGKPRGKWKHSQDFCSADDIELYDLVVIGNIHENLELLEG